MGAPKGNKNAEKHGAYSADQGDTLEERIQDLKKKRDRLSNYIDEVMFDVDPMEYAKLTDLLGRLDSRLQRLEKELAKQTGSGDPIGKALDEAIAFIGKVHGVDLSDGD